MQLPAFLSPGLAFVDIETTGGPAQRASITEIAVLQVDGSGVRTWSTLVRPESRIPAHIERLTGISNDMVAGAPRFEEIAGDLFDQLDGRLFACRPGLTPGPWASVKAISCMSWITGAITV